MATINRTNQRVITRLIESGIITEKAVTALKLKDILEIPNITKAEMLAICDLQDAIKENRVFSFFALAEETESKEGE